MEIGQIYKGFSQECFDLWTVKLYNSTERGFAMKERIFSGDKVYNRMIKKLIGLVVAAVVMTSSVYSGMSEMAVYAGYEEKVGYVTGDNVNVRSGAGTSNTSVTKLSNGHVVTIIGEAKAANGALWYHIMFTKDGTAMEGYMHSTYIKITQVGQYEEKSGYVTSDNVNVRSGAGTGFTSITKLSTGHEVKITGEATASNGALWYKITFVKNSVTLEGYMHSAYVRVGTYVPPSKPSEEFKPSTGVEDKEYEQYLEQQGFPESYRTYLRSLHKMNPLWIFVAMPTGIQWKNAVAAESKLGTNLVPSTSITSYKSLEEGAINWTTGKWTGYDTSSWVAASKQAVRYYLDPRNFLMGKNTMLQFESLNYEEGVHNKEGVEAILAGTHMEYGKTVIDGVAIDFAQIFMDAGKINNVSPYHLASRALQETGRNGSNSSNQYKEAAYAQFNGYYNFFNIGASPTSANDAMYNGLQKAMDEGWNTPEKSITGGAAIIASKYIARGQNTLYLQKFDVVDGGDGYYAHQYMTNLLAAESEAKLMEKTYENFGAQAVTFIVPVYLNMPETPASCPVDNGSPYSVLSGLSITGLGFDKEFDEYTFEYTVPVDTTADFIMVNASAYAPSAMISGNGVRALQPGYNKLEIVCTGSDGSKRTYTIHVTRKAVPKVRETGDANGDDTVDIIDALYILRASVGKETLTAEDLKYADINKDGVADAQDALQIMKYVTGSIDKL